MYEATYASACATSWRQRAVTWHSHKPLSTPLGSYGPPHDIKKVQIPLGKSRLIRVQNVMPAIRKIIPKRGREFWDSLDLNNRKQVLEAVMIEVKSKRAYVRRTKT